MRINQGTVARILEIGKSRQPREACGFVFYSGEVFEVPNVAVEDVHFMLDPSAQVRWWEYSPVIWHTHGGQSAVPSRLDLKMQDLTYDRKAMLIVAVASGQWTLTYS